MLRIAFTTKLEPEHKPQPYITTIIVLPYTILVFYTNTGLFYYNQHYPYLHIMPAVKKKHLQMSLKTRFTAAE